MEANALTRIGVRLGLACSWCGPVCLGKVRRDRLGAKDVQNHELECNQHFLPRDLKQRLPTELAVLQ